MFRITGERNIPYLLFENVKGLLNNDNGRTFGIILCALDELGYDVQWELLDSQNFGVPQHRERLFLVANLRGKPRPKVFPIGETIEEDAEEGGGEQKKREGVFSNVSPTIDANYHKGGASRPYVVTDREKLNILMRMRSHTKQNMEERTQLRKTTWTLDTSPQNKMAAHANGGIRKLTPIETERLQGLPDNWTKFIKDGDGIVSVNSDTDRWERCGRTVTISVIEAIGRRLGHEWY